MMRARPPLWLFGVLVVAGAVSPFAIVAMPFLLRREGIQVEVIASTSALAMLPFALMFIWSPLADIIFSRRNWFLIGNFGGAVLLFAAILLPRPKYLALFAVLLTAGNFAITLAFIALGGLMAVVVPDSLRGKAAGWFQAGNIGCVALVGGAALWLIERMPIGYAAAGIAALSFFPALPVLLIEEPRRTLTPSRAVFRAMFVEIGILLKKRPTWLGLFFFLSPLGKGAAFSLFSAIGVDYHASPGTVQWVTGMPGGLVALVSGALVGGAINDLFPRRLAYILFGVLVASVAAVMAVAPIALGTYVIGGLSYQFASSMAWVAFSSLALELSGAEPMTAGMRMALFNSASYVPFCYMTWMDGHGYQRWGVRGLMATDAGLSLVAAGVIVLLIRMRGLRRPGELVRVPTGQHP